MANIAMRASGIAGQEATFEAEMMGNVPNSLIPFYRISSCFPPQITGLMPPPWPAKRGVRDVTSVGQVAVGAGPVVARESVRTNGGAGAGETVWS